MPNPVKLLRDKPADRYADDVRSGNLKAIQQGREIRSEVHHCCRTGPNLRESMSTLVATHHAISSGQRPRNVIPDAKVGAQRIYEYYGGGGGRGPPPRNGVRLLSTV